MADYSIRNAAKWAAVGLGASALAGAFNATVLHAGGHFGTYETAGAFLNTWFNAAAHVIAQPEFVISAFGVSAVFGAFMEGRNWYNARDDKEVSRKAKAERNHASSPGL